MSNASTFNWSKSNTALYDVDFPNVQTGVVVQIAELNGFFLPGYDNNGDYIFIELNKISYYDSSRTLIWSKTATQIVTSHTSILAVYFSSTDNKYYVITYITGNIQLSSLDKTTGAVTNLSILISVPTPTNQGFQYYGLSQLSSTNLLFVTGECEGKIIEFSNTGTIVSNTGMIQNSVDLYTAYLFADVNSVTYQTTDGTILVGMRDNLFFISRNGVSRNIADRLLNLLLGKNLIVAWSNYIASLEESTGSYLSISESAMFFTKVDFERWLSDICTRIGI